jgi:hypothetical protein
MKSFIIIVVAVLMALLVISNIILGTVIHNLNKTEVVAPSVSPQITVECDHPIEVIVEKTASIETTDPVETEPETEPIEELNLPPIDIIWASDIHVEEWGVETVFVNNKEIDTEFLAKLLYAEAGTMDWWGKVYTCSAILNLCDKEARDLWEAGHDKNCFAVAPYVDTVTPTEEIYDVTKYVLDGGRIEDVCYFRTSYYHHFGTPVCQVGAHYFSK